MNKLKLVGRLTKSRYLHNDKLTERTEFTLLKRKSTGTLKDLIQDADYDITNIDFSSYKEGVYELKAINQSYDIESGYAEDWDLSLVKYEE